MTRRARRQHAIHHIDAQRDVIGDLLGFSDTHQVARPIARQERRDLAGHLASHRMRFADGQTSDRVSRKIKFEKLLRTRPPQIGKRCSLYNPKLPLCWLAVAARLLQRNISAHAQPTPSFA